MRDSESLLVWIITNAANIYECSADDDMLDEEEEDADDSEDEFNPDKYVAIVVLF